MSVLRQTPSVEANFFKDRAFVDQRFAGANVWQIHRVSNRKGKSALQGRLWSCQQIVLSAYHMVMSAYDHVSI